MGCNNAGMGEQLGDVIRQRLEGTCGPSVCRTEILTVPQLSPNVLISESHSCQGTRSQKGEQRRFSVRLLRGRSRWQCDTKWPCAGLPTVTAVAEHTVQQIERVRVLCEGCGRCQRGRDPKPSRMLRNAIAAAAIRNPPAFDSDETCDRLHHFR